MGSMWSESVPTCNWFNPPLLPNRIWHTLPPCLCFVRLNPGRKRSAWFSAYAACSRGHTLHTSAQSGRNYRFSEPEVNAIHLCQREGLQCGFLPDLSLHAVADVSGPNHLEAQHLTPRRRDEGAPQMDTLANELGSDHRPRRQGWDSSWKHRQRSEAVLQWSKTLTLLFLTVGQQYKWYEDASLAVVNYDWHFSFYLLRI